MTLNSTSTVPKAFLDTTVLIGSLLGPGINRDLLKMARSGMFFDPVISNVCLLEFVRNAAKGIKTSKRLQRDPYTWEEIQGFLLRFIYPVVEDVGPVNSAYSRDSAEIIERCTNTGTIREVLYNLTSLTDEQAINLAEQQEMNEPLHKFDIQDFHVWSTAIETNCDYIVTSNTKKFPKQIGEITRIDPYEFTAMVEE